jgi:hypothetical protein
MKLLDKSKWLHNEIAAICHTPVVYFIFRAKSLKTAKSHFEVLGKTG